MFRLDPGNNARIREHAAQARPLRKMVRDKPAQLVLQGSMGPAGGRHRLRLSVHELPQTAIPRVPNEKFRNGHPDRYLGNRTHDLLKWIVGAIGFQTAVILGAVVSLARVFAK
jgi:hypothetical protein